ncbi:MAG: Hint domain-containing protein [Pseudomonadota bacterium]
MYDPSRSGFGKDDRVVILKPSSRPLARRLTSGFVRGTCLEAQGGPQPVETLKPGDNLMTRRGEFVPVRRIETVSYCADLEDAYPDGFVLIPPGVMGNSADIYLLPDQLVLIDTGEASSIVGSDSALLRASALLGQAGIEDVLPIDIVTLHTLLFDQPEIVFADSRVQVMCAAHDRIAAAEEANLSDIPVLDGFAADRVLMAVGTGGLVAARPGASGHAA